MYIQFKGKRYTPDKPLALWSIKNIQPCSDEYASKIYEWHMKHMQHMLQVCENDDSSVPFDTAHSLEKSKKDLDAAKSRVAVYCLELDKKKSCIASISKNKAYRFLAAAGLLPNVSQEC